MLKEELSLLWCGRYGYHRVAERQDGKPSPLRDLTILIAPSTYVIKQLNQYNPNLVTLNGNLKVSTTTDIVSHCNKYDKPSVTDPTMFLQRNRVTVHNTKDIYVRRRRVPLAEFYWPISRCHVHDPRLCFESTWDASRLGCRERIRPPPYEGLRKRRSGRTGS